MCKNPCLGKESLTPALALAQLPLTSSLVQQVRAEYGRRSASLRGPEAGDLGGTSMGTDGGRRFSSWLGGAS